MKFINHQEDINRDAGINLLDERWSCWLCLWFENPLRTLTILFMSLSLLGVYTWYIQVRRHKMQYKHHKCDSITLLLKIALSLIQVFTSLRCKFLNITYRPSMTVSMEETLGHVLHWIPDHCFWTSPPSYTYMHTCEHTNLPNCGCRFTT